jgi:polygalacturonase
MVRSAFAVCFLLGVLHAQDARDVTEPKFPQTCASLAASLTSEGGELPEEAELHLDTARIQQAIDHCVAGRAVELRAEGGHNAFLSGPLVLKPSVTLLVAADTTLFGTRNPREYDVRPGSCGVISAESRGCKPLIQADDAPHSGVMGLGAIDGQGGEKLLKQQVSWWQLARQAQVENKSQNCPRLLVANSSDDFTLYGITLRNSPNFHVIVRRTNGFTAWGVKVDSPANARNTDGIDPASSTNVTIAYSYIRVGDDNVAIKAGKLGSATHMTFAHDHFYSGHGMSIGSETDEGVSTIRVSDLSIDGADNGIRIKSDRSRGGLVQDVAYQNVCMRNVKNPIVMDPAYSDAPGDSIPVYKDISLEQVHAVSPGKVTLLGFDEQHRLGVAFDGVFVDGVQPGEIRAQHARFEVRSGGTNLKLQGDDVKVAGSGKNGEPLNCANAFVPFPDGPVVRPLRQSADDLLPGAVTPVAGTRRTATVSADGSAEYMTVQQGMDALTPDGGTVLVKPGTYREVVHVAKPHVRLEGTGDSPEKVVIVSGNSAYSSGSTFKSATVFVTADDFLAKNVTFQNDFSRKHEPQEQGSQALALSVTGDRAIFQNVRFLGAQDTLFAASRPCHPDKAPCIPARQYFDHCYIEGHVDFIFGDSLAFFDHCEIHAIAHDRVTLTAQGKTFPEQASGYVFDHCRVTSEPGVGEILLGRPWRPYATVVFLNSELDGKVNPAGWSDWNGRLQTAFYAEYASSGPGANPAQREPYSHQLDKDAAKKYNAATFLAGSDRWKPAAVK